MLFSLSLKLKRTPLDAAVSDIVRERANWTCQRCSMADIDGQARAKSSFLDCSHIQGRNHYSTRYDIRNCLCLCKPCHQFVGDRPIDHAQLAARILGQPMVDKMKKQSHMVAKWTKDEQNEMKLHYRSELKRLRDLREIGQLGYIEVDLPQALIDKFG